MSSWAGPALTIGFVLVAVVAAVVDYRTRRIPNLLTVCGLVVALILRGIQGADPFLIGVIGAGVAALVSLPLFAVGALGGGDGKLLIAIGGFMGAGRLAGALLIIALVGGALGVLDAYRRGILVPVMLNTVDLLKHWVTLGRSGRRIGLAAPGAVTVPYGVAIAVGSLAWWFWGAKIV